MTKLRWGVVGTGNIVQREIAPVLATERQSELVAAVSRDQGRADEFTKQFGGRFAYTSYGQMLANPEVDAIFVATPNDQHAKQVLAAAAAGKHVLCDKPISLTSAEAVEEVEACQRAGVAFGVNFQCRHLPWVNDVKKLIAEGVIGDVITIQDAAAGRRPPFGWHLDAKVAGLGTIFNVGVHSLDYMRFILDSDPVETVAMFDYEGGRLEVETQALVLLRFANGATGYLNCNQSNYFVEENIAIYGSKGCIIGKNLSRGRFDGELTLRTEDGDVVTPYRADSPYRQLIAAFTRSVLDGQPPNPSGIDGLRSMQLSEAIARSVREQRLVNVEY